MKTDLVKHIYNKNLLNQNETVVIALSGGVDSMVLFNVLQALSLNLNIIIAHVNHNKRKESQMEYDEIKNIAKNKNIIFEGVTLNEINHGNFHDQSRKLRYEFFKEVAIKYNASKILLAHHLDDQLETILMRLVRGSSFAGYAGIKEVTHYEGLQIIRPLLDVTKEDIFSYSKENNISFFEDSSNKEDIYTRNRVRNEIVPLLKKENNNSYEHIMQFVEYMNLADENINKQRDGFIKEHFIDGSISVNKFNELDKMLKIKVLKFIINSKTYDTVEISFSQYNDMIELLNNKNPNVKYNLSKGYTLVKEYDNLYVDKTQNNENIFLEISNVGEYVLPNNSKYIFSYDKLGINHTDVFELCYNDMEFPLFLRNRQDGDRMKLNVGTKKVKDILIDQKVPASTRENLILLSTRDKVLWIPNIKKSKQNTNCTKTLYIYEVK